MDPSFTHVATTADDKKLRVWKVAETLELLNERYACALPTCLLLRSRFCYGRELPKKPTELGFTRDGQTIVVSDKFGDVFRSVPSPHTIPCPLRLTRPQLPPPP